jgi:hypothetical protein
MNDDIEENLLNDSIGGQAMSPLQAGRVKDKLDRLEAELRNERHRASVASTECAALHEQLRDRVAEVEMLREGRET